MICLNRKSSEIHLLNHKGALPLHWFLIITVFKIKNSITKTLLKHYIWMKFRVHLPGNYFGHNLFKHQARLGFKPVIQWFWLRALPLTYIPAVTTQIPNIPAVTTQIPKRVKAGKQSPSHKTLFCCFYSKTVPEILKGAVSCLCRIKPLQNHLKPAFASGKVFFSYGNLLEFQHMTLPQFILN